jgi:two-component system KDP operon response regulator KdpE
METATILLVDDEPVVCRVLGDALRQAGYHIEVAANGKTALERLSQPGIDLILLDLQLTDSDGVVMMKQVRQTWVRLPVIILTAHGSLASAIEAVRCGVADYILKPVSIEELRIRVADALRTYRAHRLRDERIITMFHQLQTLMEDEGLLTERARLVEGVSLTESHEPLAPAYLPMPAYHHVGPLFIDVQQHIVRMHGQPIDLTPTEFAILLELVRRPGVVVPCTQLVYSIQHVHVEEEAARQIIRPHIVRLRRKIEHDAQHPAYIQSVRGVGYRWFAD